MAVSRLSIDFHAHYWPEAYLNLLDRHGLDISYQRKQQWASGAPADLSERLSMMDAAEVDMQILSPGGPMPYFDNPQAAIESAKLANDLYRELVDQYPGRFGAFGLMPLPHVDASVEEASRCLNDLGVAGIGIGTWILGETIADERYEPFYAELDRRGAVLYVHPSGAGAGSPLIAHST